MKGNLSFFFFRFSIAIVCFYLDLCLACLTHSGCELHGKKLSCNKHLNQFDRSKDIEVVELCHLNKTELYLSALLHNFPNLKSLSVKFSGFEKIDAKFIKENYKLEVNLFIIRFGLVISLFLSSR